MDAPIHTQLVITSEGQNPHQVGFVTFAHICQFKMRSLIKQNTLSKPLGLRNSVK